MENTATAIKILREDFLFHTKEAEMRKNALIALGENPEDAVLNNTIIKGNGTSNTLYNKDWTFMEKFSYYEDKNGTVWSKKEIEEFILEQEPEMKSPQFSGTMYTRLTRAIATNSLVCLKLNRSRIYTFYTTRKEWIEKEENGSCRLLPDRYPNPLLISSLSEDQKRSENIEWKGI